jgi:polyhydroxybutyrate depolymerase
MFSRSLVALLALTAGRVSCLILLALSGLACAGSQNPTAPTDARDGEGVLGEWVAAGGHRRTYALHVPTGLDGARPGPLIVAFHGAGGTRAFAENAGLFRAADRGGFIVVSPDGVAADWALGCGCTQPEFLAVDDLRFFDTLVAHLSSRLPIDRARVYATGFSNGGTFSYRLACQRSQAVAGVAVVAGTLFNQGGCFPERPVPVIAFHGTDDPVINIWAGTAAVEHFATRNGCGAASTTTPLPDRFDDGTTLTRFDYPGCRGGGDVRFFRVGGGGHNWPGAPVAYPAWTGRQSREIEASEEIVDFFARHPAVP